MTIQEELLVLILLSIVVLKITDLLSKKAVVVQTPAAYTTKINIGDELYIHHNIFRRWYDQKVKNEIVQTLF